MTTGIPLYFVVTLPCNFPVSDCSVEIRMSCEQSTVFFTNFRYQFSNLFQFTNFTLLGGLAIGIGTIIGIFKCHQGESACNDNLTDVILIHDMVAGICVFVCVLWKMLIPLDKYLDITYPVYEGELVEILHIYTLSGLGSRI